MSGQEELFDERDLIDQVFQIEGIRIEVKFAQFRYMISSYSHVYPNACLGKTARDRAQLLFDRLTHMGQHYGSHSRSRKEGTIVQLRVHIPN